MKNKNPRERYNYIRNLEKRRRKKKLVYDEVDFSEQQKVALHTHVREDVTPSELADGHYSLGFDAIALTNAEIEIPDPTEDIIVIPAYERREASPHWANSIEHSTVHFVKNEETYPMIDRRSSGIQFWAHPHDPGRSKYKISERAEHFRQYKSFLGLEILCRVSTADNEASEEFGYGDLHPHRRGKGQYVRSTTIWSELMVDYGVASLWGIGVTDGYDDWYGADGDTWNGIYTIVLAEKDKESIKENMINGNMFWVWNYGDEENEPPVITDIDFTSDSIDITIDGDYEKVYWFYDNEVVGTGESYDLENAVEGQDYVRFEIWTNESDYWENDKEIGSHSEESDTSFYESNIVGSQPIYLDLI